MEVRRDARRHGSALISGAVGLDGVADGFKALANPEQHIKIMIEPGRAQ